MCNYWVVGATFAEKPRRDVSPEFLRRGYWYLGYTDEEAADQAERRDQICPGDRIAIKKLIGPSSPRNIRIIALGVVAEVDAEDQCIYVDWLLSGLDRTVGIKEAGPCSPGLLQSIAGPFDADDPWTRQVFQI